jgi:hypothetical protein
MTNAAAQPAAAVRASSWRRGHTELEPAGLPASGAVAQEITRHDYDVTALVIPGSDPELAGAVLAAAHRGRAQRRLAAGLDRPPDSAAGPPDHGRLASIFYRDRHRHDQELPLEP